MKEDRIIELKLQGILALLFFIGGGNIISQNGTQYPINDPRNPNCPCHKAQKLAEQEFQNLFANANPQQKQVNNLQNEMRPLNSNKQLNKWNEEKKHIVKNNINPPKINDTGISEAENEKQLLSGDLSNKNMLEEGISEAEQKNNNSQGNNFQFVNIQTNFVPQNANPIDQGISFADNEINKFIVLSNDVNFLDDEQGFSQQQSFSQQKFSSKGNSFSSRGSSSGSNFKRRHSEAHSKYKHHNWSHRYAKFKRKFACNNWHFLKEARRVASCYHWQ